MRVISDERRSTGHESANILWIGNSYFFYNNGIHHHVRELYRAAGLGLHYRGCQITISGSGLDWHDIGAYFRSSGLGRYSFVDNDVVFNTPPIKYDTVVMMDSSQGPVHPELRSSFHSAMDQSCAIVIGNGARPILFMSWPYKDRPDMTAAIVDGYTSAGARNLAQVIPAGIAFVRAMQEHPGIDLYQSDKSHPSLAGTYLAACTALVTLTGRSPCGLSYSGGLDPDAALALQQVAWDSAISFIQPVRRVQ